MLPRAEIVPSKFHAPDQLARLVENENRCSGLFREFSLEDGGRGQRYLTPFIADRRRAAVVIKEINWRALAIPGEIPPDADQGAGDRRAVWIDQLKRQRQVPRRRRLCGGVGRGIHNPLPLRFTSRQILRRCGKFEMSILVPDPNARWIFFNRLEQDDGRLGQTHGAAQGVAGAGGLFRRGPDINKAGGFIRGVNEAIGPCPVVPVALVQGFEKHVADLLAAAKARGFLSRNRWRTRPGCDGRCRECGAKD